MGTLVRTKNLFIAIYLVKLNHSHRKYSRKKVLQENIPEVLHNLYKHIIERVLLPKIKVKKCHKL